MATNSSIWTEPQRAPNPVYTIAEVAQLLGVHRATVSRFIASGELRVLRLGHRTVRITHDAFSDFLRAHEEAEHEQAS